MIFAEKILFPQFWRSIPGSKAGVSEFDPNTNYVIMVDIVYREQLS